MIHIRCRANLTNCIGLATFDDSELIRDTLGGWREVRQDDHPKARQSDKTGVCPACIEAAKPTSVKRKISGGTKFDWEEIEAGGKPIPPDKQMRMWEDDE